MIWKVIFSLYIKIVVIFLIDSARSTRRALIMIFLIVRMVRIVKYETRSKWTPERMDGRNPVANDREREQNVCTVENRASCAEPNGDGS